MSSSAYTASRVARRASAPQAKELTDHEERALMQRWLEAHEAGSIQRDTLPRRKFLNAKRRREEAEARRQKQRARARKANA